MNSFLHCLNVGEADCFLLELAVNDGTAVILIDGGSKKGSVNSLPNYLEHCGIQKVDLLILTHLHQDHLGYLGDVAAAKPVDRAVLPYLPIPLACDDLSGILEEERKNDIIVFNQMWESLIRQSCRIETMFPNALSQIVLGDWCLTCLYPTPGTFSPVYEAFCQMRGKLPEEARAIYETVCPLFNADSAIWLLEQNGVPMVLFCGDCFHSSLEQAADGRVFQVPVVKLSHHGRNDKGNLYFTPSSIQSFAPHTLILTSNGELAEQHRAEWQQICPSSQLLITSDYAVSTVISLHC